jgi:hypothetical protein
MDWNETFEIRDIRNGEWYWVQKEVLSSKKINASDKIVYSALAYYSNNKTQECFPSYAVICGLVNLHRNTVIKSIKALIKNDFISKKKKEGRANYYELLKIRTSTKNGLVPNEKGPYPKENHHPTQKRTSNNTYITRINNKKVEKIKEQIRKRVKTFDIKSFPN